MLLVGVSGYFLIENKCVHEISLGVLILWLGLISVVKLQVVLVEVNSKKPIKNQKAALTQADTDTCP